MPIAHRKTSLRSAKTKRGLRWHLEAIGVDTTTDITRDHIHRAHRIFRGAKGQREVNDLWTQIKRHICPNCDGIKWRAENKHCGPFCANRQPRKTNRNNLTTVNQN